MSARITYVLLPIFLLIAGFLYWQQHQRIYEDRGRLTVTRDGDVVVLSWQSEIDVPMQKRIREAYDAWKDRTKKFVIDLHSPGGALREGRKVIELLNTMKATHLIETHVGSNRACLSMCVPIFLQGESRVASATSKWMFHEPTAYDFFSDEEVHVPEFERNYYNNRFFDRYFTNSEMNPVWRENLRKEWVAKDVWKSGRQLVDERSNIILDLY